MSREGGHVVRKAVGSSRTLRGSSGTCPSASGRKLLQMVGLSLHGVGEQGEGIRSREERWRGGRWIRLVPYRVNLSLLLPLPAQTLSPEHSKGGQSISSLVESPTNGMPLKPPPPLGKGSERLFHLSLQGEPSKPACACTISDDCKVVSYDPS